MYNTILSMPIARLETVQHFAAFSGFWFHRSEQLGEKLARTGVRFLLIHGTGLLSRDRAVAIQYTVFPRFADRWGVRSNVGLPHMWNTHSNVRFLPHLNRFG